MRDGTPGRWTAAAVAMGACVATVLASVPPPPAVIESFILPKKINAKVVPGDPSKSRLVAVGFLDTGPDAVDLTGAATVTVAGMGFEVSSFDVDATGTKFTHEEPDLSLSITVSKQGSSKGKFRLEAGGAAATAVDPEGTLDLVFDNAVAYGTGSIELDAGKYTLGRNRGSLFEPNLYLAKGKVIPLGEGGGFSFTCGLATGGTTPETAPAVSVQILLTPESEPHFSAGVSSDDFEQSGDRFVYGGEAGGITSLVLDYAKETVTVKAKGIDMDEFAAANPSLTLRITVDGVTHEVSVRLGTKGDARVY